MKILQVCPYDFGRPGGVQQHILSLSKYLEKAGHKVSVIGPDTGFIPENVDFMPFGKNRPLNFAGTRIDINRMNYAEQQHFKQWFDAQKFDIVHYHTFWNPLLGWQVRHLAKAKHIATFHDTPKYRWVGKTLMPLAASLISYQLDAILSVSVTQSRFIKPLLHKPVHIIPNGIDLEVTQQVASVKLSFSSDAFTLLFLGRFEPRKGVMDALKTYQILKNNDIKCQLIMAGDGDLRKKAEDFVKTHHLTDVHFTGKVTDEEKRYLMQQANVFLAPALYGESFGIVLLEAMAAGLPMVGYANEGYLNVLEKEQALWFVQPGDTKSMADRLMTLHSDQQKRHELKQLGLEHVQSYDWEKLSQQVLYVYQEALK